MKKTSLLLVIIIVSAYLSCERDDICAETTATTPSVIIDLYNFESQDDSKNVSNLVIFGLDNEDILTNYSNVTTNNLVLPLKTTADTTQYVLHSDYSYDDNDTPDDTSDDIIGGNQDIITIKYNREEVYVSRACGYKTVFTGVILDIEDDGDNWILSQEPIEINQSVEDETETHFNIYH